MLRSLAVTPVVPVIGEEVLQRRMAAMPIVSVIGEEALWRRTEAPPRSMLVWPKILAVMSREWQSSSFGWASGEVRDARVSCSRLGWARGRTAGARVWCAAFGDKIIPSEGKSEPAPKGGQGFTPEELQILNSIVYAGILVAMYHFKKLKLEDLGTEIKNESIKELVKNLTKLLPAIIKKVQRYFRK